MGITATALTPATHGFAINATSADVSSGEEILAAVAGKSHYIRRLVIACISAITVTIGAGETGDNVAAVLIGPVPFTTTNGSPAVFEFNPPIKVAAATSISIDASAGGAVQVFVQGYTK